MSGELLYWSNFLIFTFLTTIVRWKPFCKKQTESERGVTFSNSLYLRALSLPLSTARRFQRNLCIIFWIAAVAFMLWVLNFFFSGLDFVVLLVLLPFLPLLSSAPIPTSTRLGIITLWGPVGASALFPRLTPQLNIFSRSLSNSRLYSYIFRWSTPANSNLSWLSSLYCSQVGRLQSAIFSAIVLSFPVIRRMTACIWDVIFVDPAAIDNGLDAASACFWNAPERKLISTKNSLITASGVKNPRKHPVSSSQ